MPPRGAIGGVPGPVRAHVRGERVACPGRRSGRCDSPSRPTAFGGVDAAISATVARVAALSTTQPCARWDRMGRDLEQATNCRSTAGRGPKNQRRRVAGSSRCGAAPAGVGRIQVRPRRDDLVDPVEHVVGGATSAAPIWPSSCSSVRGPTIAAVTAGCRITNASARWIRLSPGLLGEQRELLARRRACAGSRAARGRSGSGMRVCAMARRVSRPFAVRGRRATRLRAGSTGSRPCRGARTSAAPPSRCRGRRSSTEVGCTTNGTWPRRSATHWASTISDGGNVQQPIMRTLPWRARSESAPSVSSMSVSGSGRCTW